MERSLDPPGKDAKQCSDMNYKNNACPLGAEIVFVKNGESYASVGSMPKFQNQSSHAPIERSRRLGPESQMGWSETQ